MRQNILKFQSDIKIQVAEQKEKGYCEWWMHPAYCAYYILKHNVENKEEYIEEEIKKSYKALPDYCTKESFRRQVAKKLDEYAETICTD